MAGREYRVTIGTVSKLPLSETAADGVAATDVASWQMDGVRTPSDPVGLTDAASRVLSASRTVADPVGVLDEVTAILDAMTAEVAGAAPLGELSFAVPGSNVIYLSTTGSDGNNGLTLGAPKATATAAVTACPVDGTIVVRGGTYRLPIGAITKRLTIQPYLDEQVIFDGADVVTGWTASGGRWVKSGWTAEFNHSAPAAGELWRYIDGTSEALAYWPDGCWIDGVRQILVASNPAAGQWSVDYSANTITLGSDPTGKTVEVTAREYCALLQAVVTLRGFHVRRYAAGLTPYAGMIDIVSAGSGSVLEDMWITDAPIQALAVIGQNVTVRRCTIQDSGGTGFGANNASGLLLTHSIIRRSNRRGWKAEPITAAVKITKSNNVQVLHSIFEDVPRANNIWFDQGCCNGAAVGNLVDGSENYGIEIELGGVDFIVAGNHVVNCSATRYGIAGFDSNNLRIWNNRVEPTAEWDLGYITDERRNEGAWGYPIEDVPGNSFGIEMANNLLDGGRGRLFRLYADGDSTAPACYADSATELVQGNLITSNAGSSTTASRLAGWTNGSNVRVTYDNYAALQAAAPVVGTNGLYDGTVVPQSVLNSQAVVIAAPIPADIANLLGVAADAKVIGPPLPPPVAIA